MNTVVHSVCSLHVYPALSLSVVPAETCTSATDYEKTCPVTCPRKVAVRGCCDYGTRVCTDLASSVEWTYETAIVGGICENVGKFSTLLSRSCTRDARCVTDAEP